jgi:hypothetical protein
VSDEVESLRALVTVSRTEVVSERAVVSLTVVSLATTLLATVSLRTAAVSAAACAVVVSGAEALTGLDGWAELVSLRDEVSREEVSAPAWGA